MRLVYNFKEPENGGLIKWLWLELLNQLPFQVSCKEKLDHNLECNLQHSLRNK